MYKCTSNVRSGDSNLKTRILTKPGFEYIFLKVRFKLFRSIYLHYSLFLRSQITIEIYPWPRYWIKLKCFWFLIRFFKFFTILSERWDWQLRDSGKILISSIYFFFRWWIRIWTTAVWTIDHLNYWSFELLIFWTIDRLNYWLFILTTSW